MLLVKRQAFLCLPFFCLMFVSACTAGDARRLDSYSLEIAATAHTIHATDAPTSAFGTLTYLDSVILQSKHPHFGGFSALSYRNKELIAQTDKGRLFFLAIDPAVPLLRQFPLTPRVIPLLDEAGTPLQGTDGDAESVILSPDAGSALIAFEHQHRFEWYDLSNGRLQAGKNTPKITPDILQKLPVNGGFEGFTRLADDRLLGVGEEAYLDKNHVLAVVYAADTLTPTVLRYTTTDAGKVTELCGLPNGVVLALERRFDALTMRGAGRVQVFSSAMVDKGVINPVSLVEFPLDSGIDNLEGLAAIAQADGSFIILIISDDNFNPWQKTVLSRWLYRPGDAHP
jgi:hypothetical protein